MAVRLRGADSPRRQPLPTTMFNASWATSILQQKQVRLARALRQNRSFEVRPVRHCCRTGSEQDRPRRYRAGQRLATDRHAFPRCDDSAFRPHQTELPALRIAARLPGLPHPIDSTGHVPTGGKRADAPNPRGERSPFRPKCPTSLPDRGSESEAASAGISQQPGGSYSLSSKVTHAERGPRPSCNSARLIMALVT